MYARRIPKSSALRSVRVRAQTRGGLRRGYATESTQETASNAGSYMLAGVGGGAVTLAGVYAYYSLSGTKQTVTTAQSAISQAQALKDKAAKSLPEMDPATLIALARQTAKSYTGSIPGAGEWIDHGFGSLEEAAKKHGPEVKEFIQEAYHEISDALTKGGDEMADRIMTALQVAFSKAQELSSKFDASVIQPLLKEHPELKEAVESSYEDFEKLAEKHGPKAREIYEKTANDIKNIVSKGWSASTITEVKELIEKRSKEVAELGEAAGGDAWKEAAEKAGPYLDKMPDVKKNLDSYLSKAKDYVGPEGEKLIRDTYAQLEEIGKKGTGKEQLEEAKKLIKERGEQLQKMAKEKGGEVAGKVGGIDGLESLIKTIPGGDQILPQLGELKKVAEKRGDDVEKLVNSTYQELSEVLKRKVDEAKKLGKEAKKDAKEKS